MTRRSWPVLIVAASLTAGLAAAASPPEAAGLPFWCTGQIYKPWRVSSTAVNARLRLRFCFRVARATAGGHIERGSEWVGGTFVGSVPPPIDRTFMGDCWSGVYQSNPYTTFGIFSIYSTGGGSATKGGNSGVRWISGCIPLFGPPPSESQYMTADSDSRSFTDEYGEGVEFTIGGEDEELPAFGTALQRLGIPPTPRQLDDYPFVDGDGEGEEFVIEGMDAAQ